jgi:diguanylate cyclase (GGDEF)-like protein
MAFMKEKSGTQFDPRIVALLESHYLELEAKARRETDDIEPLKVDFLIARGGAPGAGFEPVHEHARPADDRPPNRFHESRMRGVGGLRECLDLIAEASQESQAIFELSRALGSSLSASETSSMMAHRLHGLVSFDCVAVYLRSGDCLQLQYIDGKIKDSFSRDPFPIGGGLSGWVAQNGRPIINGNPTVETNYLPATGLLDVSSSALSVPLLKGDGTIFGALTVYSRSAGAFSNEHLRILQVVEPKFSLSIQNALQFGTAEIDSKLDHLTQVPNMRYFLQSLDAEIKTTDESGRRFGVALCDLNSFKFVNDRYGHVVGNHLLASIGTAFRNLCRPGEMVARMGGDEFLFFIPADSADEVHVRLEWLNDAVRLSCEQLSVETNVSGSVGVAMFPFDGASAEELLGVADRRMYQQKQAFYSELRSDGLLAALAKVEQ